MKNWPVIPGILVSILLLLTGCGQNNGQVVPTITPFPTAAAMARTTYTVQRGEVVNSIHFTGQVVPVEQRDIFFKLPGRVRNVYIQKGEQVKEDQVLADLEGIDEVQKNLELRKLALQRAQIYAENARLNLEIFQTTTRPSTPGYEDALKLKQNDVALADLAIQEASLGITETELALENTRLRSPMDGTITWLWLREGLEVSGYQSVGIVSDLNFLEIGIDAEGDFLRRLETGMVSTIEPRRGEAQVINGTIRWLSDGRAYEGMGDNTVRIETEKPLEEAGYQVDELVDVSIDMEANQDTLWLPPYAVRKFE
jgi:hypothetical protein